LQRLETAGCFTIKRTIGQPCQYIFDLPQKQGRVPTAKTGEEVPQDLPQIHPPYKEELIELKNLKPSGSREPDPRHSPIRDLIKALHQQQFELACEWDGSEGNVLNKLLTANPNWTTEQLEGMVCNRFRSEGITPARPRIWIPMLANYAVGPLDRFGKAGVDNRSAAQQRSDRNKQAILASILNFNEGRGQDEEQPVNCERCNDMGVLHQVPEKPGPRMLPCPECERGRAEALRLSANRQVEHQRIDLPQKPARAAASA
jgi:hypothetical protein